MRGSAIFAVGAFITFLLGLGGLARANIDEVQVASSLFDEFQALCIQHEGSEAALATAAAGQGWMKIPDNMVHDLATKDIVLERKTVWLKTSEEVMDLALAGNGSVSIRGVSLPADVCVVAQRPASGTGVEEITQWAGVPLQHDKDDDFYAFVDKAGEHQPVLTQDDLIKAAPSGRLKIVGAKAAPGLNLMVYVAVRGSAQAR